MIVEKKLKDKDGGGDSKPLLDPEGTVRRRDAAIKRMLEMPARQHKEDVGIGKRREAETSRRRRSKSRGSRPKQST